MGKQEIFTLRALKVVLTEVDLGLGLHLHSIEKTSTFERRSFFGLYINSTEKSKKPTTFGRNSVFGLYQKTRRKTLLDFGLQILIEYSFVVENRAPKLKLAPSFIRHEPLVTPLTVYS